LVHAWAVQKSNWSAARGKIVRADVVAREIAVRAEAAQGRPSEASIEPTAEERRASGRRAPAGHGRRLLRPRITDGHPSPHPYLLSGATLFGLGTTRISLGSLSPCGKPVVSETGLR
jgi:hypothetical protein